MPAAIMLPGQQWPQSSNRGFRFPVPIVLAIIEWRRGGVPYHADHRATDERNGTMPNETTFELASVEFGAEPVAVFRFGYERFELRARLGPGNLEHAIAAAAEVAASVFARWSNEASAFAQQVRAGENGGPVRH